MKVILRQIYLYNFHIFKFNNLKMFHDLYSHCLTQILFKTTCNPKPEVVPTYAKHNPNSLRLQATNAISAIDHVKLCTAQHISIRNKQTLASPDHILNNQKPCHDRPRQSSSFGSQETTHQLIILGKATGGSLSVVIRCRSENEIRCLVPSALLAGYSESTTPHAVYSTANNTILSFSLLLAQISHM
jgi:hypothetical protein